MIFVKEKFSLCANEKIIQVCDYEQFKDIEFRNVMTAHILRYDYCNTIFLYLEYMNDCSLESNSYYHIITSNKVDYDKVIRLIDSKSLTNYIKIENNKIFKNYMKELYPELSDSIRSNFYDKLSTFDKVIDYNWKDFDINIRINLVKYALGIDCQETNETDESISNELYNEIKSRFKNRDINSQIDYEIMGKMVKDASKRIYDNLNKDYSFYNNWYKTYILGVWEKEEKEKITDMNNYELINKRDYLGEYFNRRQQAHILTPKIVNIYANKEKRTIIIKWHTGETTKVTCHESDTWDIEKGVMACITKYVLGNNYNAYTVLDKYIKSVKYSDKK